MKQAIALVGLMAGIALGARIRDGSQLTISFEYKDNNNQLRNKTSPSYAITEDGYAATIWVEGPYDPAVPCEIVDFERQSIRLVRVITFFENSLPRSQDTLAHPIRRNTWNYHDYNTPDFLAAVMTAGMFHYCTAWPLVEGAVCDDPILAPTDAQRQNTTTGGMHCLSTNPIVCRDHTTPWPGKTPIGDITQIPDGISGATVYPQTTVTYTWDMRDHNGGLIEEGHYLVYVQMSAERFPREIEGEIESGGIHPVAMETCWDDSYYDDKGHHRVVNLFHITPDSGFVKDDANERQWSGDVYSYLEGSMHFEYAVPTAHRRGFAPRKTGPNYGERRVDIYSANGRHVRRLASSSRRIDWDGTSSTGQSVPAGVYYARVAGSAVAVELKVMP
ncbi:MAG: hypothetical protein GF331_04950 [Chitinivibrionales bacterium]|nr:hypothetical protein [Chitinivibrionales bacterium]